MINMYILINNYVTHPKRMAFDLVADRALELLVGEAHLVNGLLRITTEELMLICLRTFDVDLILRYANKG